MIKLATKSMSIAKRSHFLKLSSVGTVKIKTVNSNIKTALMISHVFLFLIPQGFCFYNSFINGAGYIVCARQVAGAL